jgi:hypothetical protein
VLHRSPDGAYDRQGQKNYWSHHAYRANEVDTKNIMGQVNLHRAAHREQTAKLYSSRDGT